MRWRPSDGIQARHGIVKRRSFCDGDLSWFPHHAATAKARGR